MIQKIAESYSVRIYLSGPLDIAKQTIRAECLREGLCVTIEPTTYIYTGGEESGYVVGLTNYPRFPVPPEALDARALHLAGLLLDATFQHSALIVSPAASTWVTKRAQSNDID